MCSILIELTVNYLKRGLAWLYDKSTFENDFVQNGSWKNFKRCRIQRFVELAILLISKKLISNLIFWRGEILSLSLSLSPCLVGRGNNHIHALTEDELASATPISIFLALSPNFLHLLWERETHLMPHTYLPTYLPTNVSFSILPPYHNFLTFFRWQIVINVLSKLQVYTYIHVICMV